VITLKQKSVQVTDCMQVSCSRSIKLPIAVVETDTPGGSSTLTTDEVARRRGRSIGFVGPAVTIIGPKSALVTFANYDSDENPYTFTVLGAGL
jgi:hypothetical protein